MTTLPNNLLLTLKLYQIPLNKIPINYRKNSISSTSISPNVASRKTLSSKRVQPIKFSFGKSVQLCQFTLNDLEGQ